jgi:penicillin-binding protein 2
MANKLLKPEKHKKHTPKNKLVHMAQQRQTFSRRMFMLRGAQTALGAALVARMGWLSIVENDRFFTLAENNRVSNSLIPPRRGLILDRYDKPLASNQPTYRVDVIPDRMQDKAKTIAKLVEVLQLNAEDQSKIQDSLEDAAGFQPVQIADNISYAAFSALAVHMPELPGVVPAQSYSRYYPTGASVAHLLGYVGSASQKEVLADKDPLLITPGYKLGKAGIEKVMNARLKGQAGARRTEVTATGKLIRELPMKPDIQGDTLRLTVNADLQDFAARRLGPNSGAAIVLDCLNGDILALTSMPAFDPNSFSQGISRAEWAMLSGDDHLPLNNKALLGLYPSGSTIKPAMALSLMAAGIHPEEQVVCTGSYPVGSTIFHCDKHHGAISMRGAIVHSCDIYFYAMCRRVGVERLSAVMHNLGLGMKYDLPVPNQKFGTVPDPAWLMRRYKKSWGVGDTINLSIGQGYLLVNPLQLTVMMARIASGREITPHLLLDHPHAEAPLLQGINQEHFEFVRKAMYGVVNEGGTAASSALPLPNVKMAGKTGTAQVRRISLAEHNSGVLANSSLGWKMRDHSWFTGFAPADNPRYAATCLVEHGGFGAEVAAPIVRDLLTFLYDADKARGTLAALENSWGGTLTTRMQIKRAEWLRIHDPAHAPKKIQVDENQSGGDAA